MSDISEFLAPQDPEVAKAIADELGRQRDKIELIASVLSWQLKGL